MCCFALVVVGCHFQSIPVLLSYTDKPSIHIRLNTPAGQVQYRLIGQNLISAGTPLVGGGLLGFATGFAIRKIMKLVFIGLGLLMLVLGFLDMRLRKLFTSILSDIKCNLSL